MPDLAKILRADTNEPVDISNAAGRPYLAETPVGEKEYARKDGEWVEITEELKMARWFAETDRVITNTTIPATRGSDMVNLPVTTRRVRVGNIYLYRFYIEGGAGPPATIAPGEYIVGTPDDYPELTAYEFSSQMGGPVFERNAGGGLTIASNSAGMVQPNGIILYATGTVYISDNASLIFEATRSQMGPWA